MSDVLEMDLKKQFLGTSKEQLLTNGFFQEVNGPKFACTSDTITKILSFDIDSSWMRFNIKPQLLIRNNAISELRKGFAALPHKGDYYYTVVTQQYSLAQLYQRPEFKTLGYIIKDEESLQNSISNFRGFMNEIGFPFFERFEDLADFDNWFSEPILKGTYDFKRGNILNFAVEGLVAAKLNKNHNYEKLYEIWMSSISPDYTEALQILRALKLYLDEIVKA